MHNLPRTAPTTGANSITATDGSVPGLQRPTAQAVVCEGADVSELPLRELVNLLGTYGGDFGRYLFDDAGGGIEPASAPSIVTEPSTGDRRRCSLTGETFKTPKGRPDYFLRYLLSGKREDWVRIHPMIGRGGRLAVAAALRRHVAQDLDLIVGVLSPLRWYADLALALEAEVAA